MPHQRLRFLTPVLKKQAKLWPVVGLVGMRQSGKTTLMRDQLEIANYVSLDDVDELTASETAPKVFLSRQQQPIIIDEIQKSPKLFDTIKLVVDKKRLPGQFFITGSSQFSSRIGIRESLTGRIGLCQLFPLTLAEARQASALKQLPSLMKPTKPRFSWEDLLAHAECGGMPVPMFLRDVNQVRDYWKGWTETAVFRDMLRCFSGAYRPEITQSILRTMGQIMAMGDLPSLQHFEIDSRRLRHYLEALETIFLVRRIPCHLKGVGKDVWIFGDSGLAKFYLPATNSDHAVLALVRHALWNETSALLGYFGEPDQRTYFKSARGSPIDWVWNNIPMKIVTSLQKRDYSERALHGSMKSLGTKHGFLIAPVNQVEIPPKSGGIGVLPWSHWS